MENKLEAISRAAMKVYRAMAKKLGVPKEQFVEFCLLSEENVERELQRRSIHRKGGLARQNSMSAKQRKESASKAARARWAKKKK